MYANIREILDRDGAPLDIIGEFAQLSSRRKVLVCDHLFSEGRRAFQQTVSLLWPDATSHDIKILEQYLHALKRAAL